MKSYFLKGNYTVTSTKSQFVSSSGMNFVLNIITWSTYEIDSEEGLD